MNTQSRKHWPVFFVAASSAFLVFLDASMLFVAFRTIGRAFPQASPGTLSWVLNAYTILFAALLVPAGRVADLKGRKRVILVGLALFAAAALVAGAAADIEWLIAARFVQAIGAALITPASLALILAAFPKEKRAIVVGLWGAAGALAGVLGPTVGALVTVGFGWRYVFFLVDAATALIIWLFAAKVFRESRAPNVSNMPNALSVLCLVLAVGNIALSIVQVRSWGLVAAPTLIAAAAGLVLLVVFALHARRHPVPAIDVRLFAEPTFRRANIATFVFGVVFTMMFFGNLLFFQQVWHFSLLQAALGIAPGPLMVIPAAILGGRLAAVRGHRPLLIAGGVVYAAGGLWYYTMLSAQAGYVSAWLPGGVLTGIGVGLLLPSLSGAAVARLTAESFGAGSGANQAIRQIGGAIGIAADVALVLQPGTGLAGFDHVFLAIAIGGAMVALLSRGIETHPRLLAQPA